MQNYVNLLYREEEREMLPLCRDSGVGVIPWSPLAAGKLTRPWGESGSQRAQSVDTSERAAGSAPQTPSPSRTRPCAKPATGTRFGAR